LCESVEREWVFAEVVECEDGFGIWKFEPLEVGVESRLWGAEVGDTR
jgi:hypothetical protein